MKGLCTSIALSIAWSIASASAGPVVGDPGTQPLFRCVVDYMTVDGLPLLRHSWCTRLSPGGPAIDLMSDEGRGIVFGIRPDPRPPIPKIYKRME